MITSRVTWICASCEDVHEQEYVTPDTGTARLMMTPLLMALLDSDSTINLVEIDGEDETLTFITAAKFAAEITPMLRRMMEELRDEN